MGMFDYIVCDYQLPDGHNDLEGWQTKDTEAQFLDTYIITEDGRLLHRDYDIEDRSACALAGHDPNTCTEHTAWQKLGGCMSTVNPRNVEVMPLFDGDIYFYTSTGPGFSGEWVEYRATFRNGRVTEMTRIPNRFAETMEA